MLMWRVILGIFGHVFGNFGLGLLKGKVSPVMVEVLIVFGLLKVLSCQVGNSICMQSALELLEFAFSRMNI